MSNPFYYNLGDGDVTIQSIQYDSGSAPPEQYDPNSPPNRQPWALDFGPGILANQISFLADLHTANNGYNDPPSGNLLVKIQGQGTIRINSFYPMTSHGPADFPPYGAVGSFFLSDGTTLPVQISQTVINGSIVGTSGDDLIIGDNTQRNSIWGKAGNDTLSAGTAGDLLVGGAGNDLLKGSTGNDQYWFYRGSGNDTIQDTGGWNQIKFLNNETENSVVLFEDSQGTLHLGYTDSTDTIDIQKQNSTGWINHFELQDSSFLTGTDIQRITQDMSAYAAGHGMTITSLQDVKNNPDLMALVVAGWRN